MTTVEQRLAALENKVTLLEAREAIRQLITSYGPMVDTTNTDEKSDVVATLWIEGGAYDVDQYGCHEGRAKIAESFHGFGLFHRLPPRGRGLRGVAGCRERVAAGL